MRRLLASAVAALTLGSFGLIATPAHAADGRSPDVRGEIAAILHHTMGRDANGPQPDHHTVDHYLPFAEENCQWGVIDATYRMATSAEAQERWGHDDQNLAGMLYAGPLDRAPDDEGLRTYTRFIGEHGIELATAQMLGSPEYRMRLATLCNTGDDGLSASMYDWQTAQAFITDNLLTKAISLGSSCLATNKLKDLVDLKKNPTNKQLFVGITGTIAGAIHDQTDGTCEAVKQLVEAAWRVYSVIHDGGDGHNPVFIQFDTHKSWWTAHMVTYFAIRVGTNPTDWREWEGKTAAG